MRRMFATTAVTVMLMAAAAVPAVAGTGVGDPAAYVEQRMAAIHNEHRRAAGLTALEVFTDLRSVARGWSHRMAADGRMYHNPDFGSDICCWLRVGENIAYRTTGADELTRTRLDRLAAAIMEQYMGSPGHRANILESDYEQLGVGVKIVRTDRGFTVWNTVDFRDPDRSGDRLSGRREATPKPEPEPDPEFEAEQQPRPDPDPTAACPERTPEDGLGDVGPSIHEPRIDCLMWWGVGFVPWHADADGAGFDPGRATTRGEVAETVGRLLALVDAGPAVAGDRFPDDDGTAYEDAIDRVAAAGVVRGFADGTFRPDRPVTRGQMATFLMAAAEALVDDLPDGDARSFPDAAGSVHERAVEAAAAAGLVTGYADGTFRPGQRIARDQLATMVSRLLDAGVEAGTVSPPRSG